MSNSALPDSDSNAGQTGPYLHIEGVGSHKWRWVKAAKASGQRLRDWVIESLNAEASRQLPGSDAKTGGKE